MTADENTPNLRERLEGLLIGTAVGDSMGLPLEGLSRRRIAKLFPGPWRQRLVFGRGMLSDDSEHAFMVGHALLKYPDNPDRFLSSLAWKLRWWVAALPAGVGWATLRACLRLWIGIPATSSGVDSAGNGPAMRAPLIGAFFAGDPEKMEEYIYRSSCMTHANQRALTGARAVAEAAAFAIKYKPGDEPNFEPLYKKLSQCSAFHDWDWKDRINALLQYLANGYSVDEFASAIGCRTERVSGYIYETVPVAIYAWLKYFGDFRATVTSVLELGGDTDTVGAIAGALAGAVVGVKGIPEEWRGGIMEWPRGVNSYSELAGRLADRQSGLKSAPVGYFWPAVPIRNVFFMMVVLFHGFRRMFPPY